MKDFEYHRPTDSEELLRLMTDLPEAQVLAGGTDLLVDIDTGIRDAQHVISLKNLPELGKIEEGDGEILVGAACTANELERSPLIRKYFPEIIEMIPTFASPQVRARATVGGNICSAVACGDFPVILIALGARIELSSQDGNRTLLLGEFFVHNRKTERKENEILTRIIIPVKAPSAAVRFEKFQRRASNSLAVVSVAAFLDIQNGKCHDAKIVLGAVAPTPLIAEKASEALVGKNIDEQIITHAAELAQDEARPITDVRGTDDYRRKLVNVLVKRALTKAAIKIDEKRRREI